MSQFNNGKIYHGSADVMSGKLQGSTDTDYFYFFCPKCPDRHIMRILDCEIKEQEIENPYNEKFTKKAKKAFTIAFQIYCEKCNLADFVKISNIGLQGGTHQEALQAIGT
jgi:predicted RNA-binding Zn-ribbon protein involved in translation (DUF1610 family)